MKQEAAVIAHSPTNRNPIRNGTAQGFQVKPKVAGTPAHSHIQAHAPTRKEVPNEIATTNIKHQTYNRGACVGHDMSVNVWFDADCPNGPPRRGLRGGEDPRRSCAAARSTEKGKEQEIGRGQ